MEWTKILEVVIIPLVLIEGFFAYLRIKTETKKKKVEKHVQYITKSWHDDINKQIGEIAHIGDLVLTNNNTKQQISKKIKSVRDELTHIRYCLLLFSLEQPLEVIRALNYFQDRKNLIDIATLKFFEIKLKDFKGKEKEYKIIEELLSKMLVSNKESKKDFNEDKK